MTVSWRRPPWTEERRERSDRSDEASSPMTAPSRRRGQKHSGDPRRCFLAGGEPGGGHDVAAPHGQPHHPRSSARHLPGPHTRSRDPSAVGGGGAGTRRIGRHDDQGGGHRTLGSSPDVLRSPTGARSRCGDGPEAGGRQRGPASLQRCQGGCAGDGSTDANRGTGRNRSHRTLLLIGLTMEMHSLYTLRHSR